MQCIIWFQKSLDDVDLMLIPLAFNTPQTFDIEALKKETGEHNKLLAYMQRRKVPKNDSDYAVSIIVDIKFEKNKVGEVSFSYDKNGVPIYYESEEEFRKKYPLTYKCLIDKIKSRYIDFKLNNGFNSLMRELKKNEKLCKKRYLDPVNQKGTSRDFYSTNIFKELDKRYKLK